MDEMCPKCGAVLQLLISDKGRKAEKLADDGVQAEPIRWCIACSYTSEKSAIIRAAVAQSGSGAFFRFRTMGKGAFDESTWKRWQQFEVLVANAEQEGVLLAEAYQAAKADQGRWIPTALIVDWRQLTRKRWRLSWKPCEPPMAVRCHSDGMTVDLAMNAYKVMPASQARPTLWGLITGPWLVQRMEPVYERHAP